MSKGGTPDWATKGILILGALANWNFELSSDAERVSLFDHTSRGATTYHRIFCLCSPGAKL